MMYRIREMVVSDEIDPFFCSYQAEGQLKFDASHAAPTPRCTGKDRALGPYFIVFAIFALQAFMAASYPLTWRRGSLFITGLLITIFVGLRAHVGCDWGTYLETFHRLERLSFFSAVADSRVDPAYAAINWLSSKMGLGIWGVNLVCAAIFSWGLVRLCKAQPNPSLAILIATPYLITVVAMGYTRQAAALGLIMYASTLIERRSNLKIAVTLIAAAAFHKSAIIVAPFFILSLLRGAALGVVLPAISALVGYQLFLQGSVDLLVKNYIGARYSSSGALIRLLMNIPSALLFIGYRKRFELGDRERIFWLSLSIASIVAVILLFASPSSTAVDRTALYLIPLQVVALSRLPVVAGKAGSNNLFAVSILMIYSLAVQIVWLTLGTYASCWIPYRSFGWGQ